ncbi:MAG: branched-chain amino acid ABC transporter permease [Desulfobacteraceae bacterium]|jgi:branched-chain amino acid transport system permease protein|nr:MAG: branched-chain amino acid ABC transporter permease [Desulfobacteraceae bacterium]
MLERILVNGLVTSGTYAVLAVGFSLIFGVAKIFNMAHTALYMITAFLIFVGTNQLGFPYALSAVVSVGATIGFGLICYALLFDRVKVHQTAVMIISLAVAMLGQEILLLTLSGHYRGIAPFVTGSIDILGVAVLYQHLFTVLGCLATLFGLWALLTKTNLGKAIRAVAQDSETANLMGINVSRVCLITMGISAGLAAVAAVVAAPLEPLHPGMWMLPLTMILAAVVLGGLGSIKGSVFGAIILGFAETIVVTAVPGGSFLRGAVSLAAMVLVLIARPEGLFGVVFEEERL